MGSYIAHRKQQGQCIYSQKPEGDKQWKNQYKPLGTAPSYEPTDERITFLPDPIWVLLEIRFTYTEDNGRSTSQSME